MRRLGFRGGKRPAWLFVLLLLGGVTLVSGIPYAIASRDARSPGFEHVPTSLAMPAGVSIDDLEEARVYDIVDGDTIEVFIGRRLETVRYFGVDTPERGDFCSRDATERNRRLVGGDVLLLADARDRDDFGRLLRYVFKDDGTSVDATLVAEGLGWAWRADGRYRDDIVAIEGEARAGERGCLWQADDSGA